MVPHFSKELLYPTDNRKKMKVINSCRILSKTAANALRFYAERFSDDPDQGIDPSNALPLAEVLEMINDWFDMFNSRKGEGGLKAPFTGKLIFFCVLNYFYPISIE